MPRQQIVFAANTMDFWRQSINGLSSNLNNAFSTTFYTEGNVRLIGSSLSLNVANGSIKGNGSLLFSMNAIAMFGTANNAKLQNNTLSLTTSAGLSGGSMNVSLGDSITLTVAVNNSISNTRTDIPASANALAWAMSKANTDMLNASLVSSLVDETFGGTGETTYSAGQVLIGNTQSGKLDKTVITGGVGVATSTGNGSVTVSANLIQGSGILLSSSGNSGITIIANAHVSGNATQKGIVQLYDGDDSTSTSLAVTANAVNAVLTRAATTPGTANLIGRMIDRRVYTTSNLAGDPSVMNGTWYVWNKPNNVNWVMITAVGGGAAGGKTDNCIITGACSFGPPGGAGAVQVWAGLASDITTSSIDVFVGGGGYNKANSTTNRAGKATSFGSFLVAKGGLSEDVYAPSAVVIGNTDPEIIYPQTTGGYASSTYPTENFWDRPFNIQTDRGHNGWWQMGPNRNVTAAPNYAFAGNGGQTAFGVGGYGGAVGGVTNNLGWAHGGDAIGYGSGGGGSLVLHDAGSPGTSPPDGYAYGGNGAPGLLIIESYSTT